MMSDGTHLSNFPGDTKDWHVYMTIGHLSSKLRQMPSMHSILMVAVLPIPIKNRNIPQKRLDEQQHTNREVLNKILRRVLQPLTFKQNPSAESGYYNILRADGNFRRCNPDFAAWLVLLGCLIPIINTTFIELSMATYLKSLFFPRLILRLNLLCRQARARQIKSPPQSFSRI